MLAGFNCKGAVMPDPDSGTDCVPEVVFSVTDAERKPVPWGLNTTLTVQLPAAGILVPQVFVSGKLLGLVPVILMLVTETATVPGFVTDTGIVALLVKTT